MESPFCRSFGIAANAKTVVEFVASPLETKDVKHNPISLAVVLTLTASASVCAQSAPPKPPTSADVLRQVAPPSPPRAAEQSIPDVKAPPLPPPLTRLAVGPAVQVREIRVEGSRVIAAADLERLLANSAGQLTLAQMEELASRVTLHYRSRGYFVARAYVPQQDLTSGILTLRVVEGNYGQFLLANKSLVRDDVVQGLLDDIKDRDIVSLDTLERAMLIINDTPGVKVVRADVMPGKALGTSDFAIGTEATSRSDGYVLYDNYGSRYTGRNRLSFNADWNSPTGRGDRLSLSGLGTENADLLNLRAAYSTLVSTAGSRVEAALSRTRYSLGDTYEPLGATGTADTAELNFNWPYKRTRSATIELGAGAAHRQLRDEIDVSSTKTRKSSNALYGRVNGNWNHALLGFDGLTQLSASVTFGKLRFHDALAASLDASGSMTAGGWSKVNLAISRISALPSDFQLLLSARMQHVLASKNLDGSERMSVSGPGAVLVYPSGELAGDNAFVARGELSRPVYQQGETRVSASAFASWGVASIEKPLLETNRTRKLADAGVGADVNYGRWLLKASVAHRLQGGPARSEPASKTRFFVQAGLTF